MYVALHWDPLDLENPSMQVKWGAPRWILLHCTCFLWWWPQKYRNCILNFTLLSNWGIEVGVTLHYVWGWRFKPPFSFSPGQWTPRLFAAFSNELFVHGGIASRKPAKHVIVVKYLTLLGEALSPGDKRVDVDVSEVSTLRFYWDFYVCNPKFVCLYIFI